VISSHEKLTANSLQKQQDCFFLKQSCCFCVCLVTRSSNLHSDYQWSYTWSTL